MSDYTVAIYAKLKRIFGMAIGYAVKHNSLQRLAQNMILMAIKQLSINVFSSEIGISPFLRPEVAA